MTQAPLDPTRPLHYPIRQLPLLAIASNIKYHIYRSIVFSPRHIVRPSLAKVIKTVGSTYDKARRLGGKLSNHVAATVAALTSEASPEKSNIPRDGSEKTVARKKSSKRSPADGGRRPPNSASGRKTAKNGNDVSGGGGGDETVKENRICAVS